ncbi:MAG: hypothetical protein IJK34_03825, partial [Clostridia bacterium]|nr:hypothetical protein [Clostridia bacterium]
AGLVSVLAGVAGFPSAGVPPIGGTITDLTSVNAGAAAAVAVGVVVFAALLAVAVAVLVALVALLVFFSIVLKI